MRAAHTCQNLAPYNAKHAPWLSTGDMAALEDEHEGPTKTTESRVNRSTATSVALAVLQFVP